MLYIPLLYSDPILKPTTTKKKKSIDVVTNLETTKNVELVRLPVLLKYIEYDRMKDHKYEDGDQYLEGLEQDISKMAFNNH